MLEGSCPKSPTSPLIFSCIVTKCDPCKLVMPITTIYVTTLLDLPGVLRGEGGGGELVLDNFKLNFL